MPVLALPEPYANATAAQHVREALASLGEEVMVLSMFHEEVDSGVVQRCTRCWDDVYQQASESDCPVCYGTSFQGGVRQRFRAWALFTDDQGKVEKFTRRGLTTPHTFGIQLEHYPEVTEHDYVVRVASWSNDHRPLALGDRYSLMNMTEISLRTGAAMGNQTYDRLGYRGQAEWQDSSAAIYLYPIPSNTPVPRVDGLAR